MANTKSRLGKLTNTTIFRSSLLSRLLILAIMLVGFAASQQSPSGAALAASACNVTEAKYQCTNEGVLALNECYNFWGSAIGDVMCRSTFDDTFYACWKRLGCPNTVYPFPL